jgi:hypothetical protein
MGWEGRRTRRQQRTVDDNDGLVDNNRTVIKKECTVNGPDDQIPKDQNESLKNLYDSGRLSSFIQSQILLSTRGKRD